MKPAYFDLTVRLACDLCRAGGLLFGMTQPDTGVT